MRYAPGRVPLVLLHGFTGSSHAWGEPVLRALRARGPVVAVDLPGHGSPLPADQPPDFLETVDALARIPAERGWSNADWIGYSMGGRLALAVAVRHPERVRRLVLESSSPGLRTEAERRARRSSDEALARRLVDRGIEPFVSYWMELPLFRSQRALSDSVLRATRERRLSCDAGALAAVLRGLGTGSQPSYWEALDGLDRPVLVVNGELDSKYVEIGRTMAERLPRATRVVIEGAGHTVHLEAPDAWLRVVTGFLHNSSTIDPSQGSKDS